MLVGFQGFIAHLILYINIIYISQWPLRSHNDPSDFNRYRVYSFRYFILKKLLKLFEIL